MHYLYKAPAVSYTASHEYIRVDKNQLVLIVIQVTRSLFLTEGKCALCEGGLKTL